MKNNPHLKKAILEVVGNQLRDNKPPDTRLTLDRLLAEGYPKDEAKNLIGCVVVSEIFDIMKEGKPFDQQRYVKALEKLPQLPKD